jgi:hypothetical protein
MAVFPFEADTPLVIDPDRMLTPPPAFSSLEPISRWHREISKLPSIVDQTQLPKRGGLNVRRKTPAPDTFLDSRRLRVAEANDHACV